MADSQTVVVPARPASGGLLGRWLGGLRLAYLPVLLTYF